MKGSVNPKRMKRNRWRDIGLNCRMTVTQLWLKVKFKIKELK